jgi:hypothetical protein
MPSSAWLARGPFRNLSQSANLYVSSLRILSKRISCISLFDAMPDYAVPVGREIMKEIDRRSSGTVAQKKVSPRRNEVLECARFFEEGNRAPSKNVSCSFGDVTQLVRC